VFHPIFGSSLLCPKGWMHQDATWYGGRPQPRRLCYMGTQPPTPKGAEPHPIFCLRLLWPNGCYGGMGLGLRDIGPITPLPIGAQLQYFRPMCVVAKRLWPSFCVTSPNSVASGAHCVNVVEGVIVRKVHVRYLIS